MHIRLEIPEFFFDFIQAKLLRGISPRDYSGIPLESSSRINQGRSFSISHFCFYLFIFFCYGILPAVIKSHWCSFWISFKSYFWDHIYIVYSSASKYYVNSAEINISKKKSSPPFSLGNIKDYFREFPENLLLCFAVNTLD